MATQTFPQPRINSHLAGNISLWALQVGIAFLMFNTGFHKLSGDPMMVGMFGVIGLGQWFRYLTGSLEVIGAVGLLVPRITGYAAGLLAVVMSGAVLTHLAVIGGSPLLPLTLLAVSVVIAWFRVQRD